MLCLVILDGFRTGTDLARTTVLFSTIETKRVIRLGDLAQYVLDKRIRWRFACSATSIQGPHAACLSIPLRFFIRRDFRVTLNTDNRLMSDTTMTREFEAARDTFGLSLEDFEKITINAMKSAFLPYDQRCDFIYSAIKPAYARVRNSQATK